MSRYNVILTRDDKSTAKLATFEYYEDVTMFLKWKPELRTAFDEDGREDYNPNTKVLNNNGEFGLFNSPRCTPVSIHDTDGVRSKREVAMYMLGMNASYDHSIPSPWADDIVAKCEGVEFNHKGLYKYERHELYGILIGGVVWYYPKRSIFGTPAILTKEALDLLLWVYAGEK